MIKRRHIDTIDGARRAQVVAHGNWIFFSGIHPAALDGDAKEQTRSALARLDALLAEMGEDQRSIFVVHVWLKDMRHFSAMNAVWNEWADPAGPPARTCIAGDLHREDLLVELVVTACRAGRS